MQSIAKDQVVVRSADGTILFEAQIIHSLVYCFFYLLPVSTTLNELVNVLLERMSPFS